MPRHRQGPNPSIGGEVHGGTVKSAQRHKSRDELERQFSDPNKPTDYEEVWFAGVHCGVCSFTYYRV